MKVAKFLAIGVTSLTFALSAQANDSEMNNYNNANNGNGNNASLETPEFLKDTGNFLSRIGSSLKSGIQSATVTTGQVIQKTGKGLQDLASDNNVENNVATSVASNKVESNTTYQNKDKSVNNVKKIRENSTKPNKNKNDKVTSYIF